MEEGMNMEWSLIYGSDRQPDCGDITDFLGEGAPLWVELQTYLEGAYGVPSKMSYSNCSAQPGWNVKYQKSGKSLCTMYPMDGYFIALIVIGVKEESEVEAAAALGQFTPYLQELYQRTAFSCGGRWLMIRVTDRATLEDVKKLIAIRVRPKGV
jgi:hypothetical protein